MSNVTDHSREIHAEPIRFSSSEEVAFLSRTALDFVELDDIADFHRYVAERLSELVPGAVCFSGDFDEDTLRCELRAEQGLGSLTAAVTNLLEARSARCSFIANDKWSQRMKLASLIRLPSNIAGFNTSISEETGQEIIRLLGRQENYGMGIVHRGKMFGVVALLMKADGVLEQPRLIEAFTHQAAVALSRLYAARELREQEKQLAISTQIAEMSSVLRHDLGNNLNTLKATLSSLHRRSEEMTEEDRQILIGRGLESLGSAERLLRDVREFQRYDRVCLRKIDLGRLFVERVGYIIENVNRHGVRCILRSGQEKIFIQGDEDALLRIIQNALNNAADACGMVDDPHIEVILRGDASRAVITIGDNGCGIPTEQMERVFTPFYTTKIEGSGLGLAIIQKLTKAMGGEVRITSQVNAGTTLTLSFPFTTNQ